MKRFALMAALGAMLCGSMIAGCGGGDDTTTTTTTTPPPGMPGGPIPPGGPGSGNAVGGNATGGNAMPVPAPVTNSAP